MLLILLLASIVTVPKVNNLFQKASYFQLYLYVWVSVAACILSHVLKLRFVFMFVPNICRLLHLSFQPRALTVGGLAG